VSYNRYVSDILHLFILSRKGSHLFDC